MSLQDQTKQLESVVSRLLAETESEELEDQWAIAQQLLNELPVRGFYAVNDETYANLVILTDKSIIDIVADEDEPESSRLDAIFTGAIGGLHLHPGPVQTLPGTEDSQLTLVLSLIGATDVGPYWFAEDDSEERHLSRFGQALMEVMNHG